MYHEANYWIIWVDLWHCQNYEAGKKQPLPYIPLEAECQETCPRNCIFLALTLMSSWPCKLFLHLRKPLSHWPFCHDFYGLGQSYEFMYPVALSTCIAGLMRDLLLPLFVLPPTAELKLVVASVVLEQQTAKTKSRSYLKAGFCYWVHVNLGAFVWNQKQALSLCRNWVGGLMHNSVWTIVVQCDMQSVTSSFL